MSEFDHWKNSLDQYESPVSDRAWEGIASAIQPQRKRKYWIFWLFGMGLIALTTLFIIPRDHNEVPAFEEETTQFYQIPGPRTEVQSEVVFDHSNTGIEEDRQMINEELKVDKPQVLETTNLTGEENIYTGSESTSKTNSSMQKDLDDTPVVQKVDLDSNLENKFNSKQLRERREESKVKMSPIRLEPLASLTLNTIHSKEEMILIDRCDLPDPPIGCPKLGKRSGLGGGLSKWALDLTYGPGYPLRSLTAKSSEFESYALLRDANEVAVYDEMVQARVSYISKWGVAARTGLNYGHLVEKLAFTRDSVTGSTTTITIDTVFNPDGSFTITSDTSNVVTSGRLEKVKYNHFTTLQIPIILGYEYRMKDWTFHFNGGVLMNFYLNRRGEILDPSDIPVDISTSTSSYDAFKDRWNMILYGSIGANYRIGERLHAVVEPSFRYTLNPITADSYPLDQKYLILNLNLGLRYEF